MYFANSLYITVICTYNWNHITYTRGPHVVGVLLQLAGCIKDHVKTWTQSVQASTLYTTWVVSTMRGNITVYDYLFSVINWMKAFVELVATACANVCQTWQIIHIWQVFVITNHNFSIPEDLTHKGPVIRKLDIQRLIYVHEYSSCMIIDILKYIAHVIINGLTVRPTLHWGIQHRTNLL